MTNKKRGFFFETFFRLIGFAGKPKRAFANLIRSSPAFCGLRALLKRLEL
jgi:hypothetical protein